jgi:hypothetical protein
VSQYPIHYSSAGNSDVLDIEAHKNVGLSDVTIPDVLDTHHMPTVSHVLNDVRTRNLSELPEKFTNWERFESLTSELFSPRIQINLGKEGDKGASDITASIPSAHRLSASEVELSFLNNDLPGLHGLIHINRE